MLNRSLDALQERRLAGDGRAGNRVRAEARRLQWQFARRSWVWLASTVVLAGAATAGLMFLVHDAFLRGLILGVALVSTLGGLWTLVVQFTSTGPIAMGALAEVWTAGELRPFRKVGWHVVNHVALRPWDIDHVLVGPGGVIAVETKWSAEGWTLDPPESRLLAAVDQVRNNARDLRLWRPELRSAEAATTRAVVFLWGGTRAFQRKPADSVDIGGVQVVYGMDAARRWRARELANSARRLTDDQAERIWAELRRAAVNTDLRDSEAGPRPPTLAQIYWTGTGVAIAAVSAVLASGYAFTLTRSVWAWATCVAGLLVLGVVGRRTAWLRLPALAWLTGLACTVFAVLVLALVQWAS